MSIILQTPQISDVTGGGVDPFTGGQASNPSTSGFKLLPVTKYLAYDSIPKKP